MLNLDVICIGAVNYDYMFQCAAEDLHVKEAQDGDEKLSNPIGDVEADIFELAAKGRAYTTQIGGSAFITLKVVKSIFENLQVAYVGVCGTPSEFDIRYGKTNDIENELAHLNNKEWLFRTTDLEGDSYHKAIAKSIVRLYDHSRNCIKIAPCANGLLLEQIVEKERTTGESFAEYLACAKWIHVSSLSDYSQFEAIMGYVFKAKQLNPELKISMDPGFEYTSVKKESLRKLVRHVDYVFLNEAEKNNLVNNESDRNILYRSIREYFTLEDGITISNLIVKYEDRHEVLRFVNGETEICVLPHQKLDISQMNNDTGAGDSFAGGFVAGMLCKSLNNDIEGPIRLGVLAARGRIISHDYENPYEKIRELTEEFR